MIFRSRSVGCAIGVPSPRQALCRPRTGIGAESRRSVHRPAQEYSSAAAGRLLFLRAGRLLTARAAPWSKARVVRQRAGTSAPLSAHLNYLRRDGVAKEGEPARMF